MRGDGGNRNAENFNGAQIAWQGVPPASLQLLGELQEGEREGDSHSCGEAGPDAVSPQVPQSLGGWPSRAGTRGRFESKRVPKAEAVPPSRGPHELPGGGTRLRGAWAAGPATARCAPTSAGNSGPYASPRHVLVPACPSSSA